MCKRDPEPPPPPTSRTLVPPGSGGARRLRPTGVLAAVGALVFAASLAGHVGWIGWPLELASHFRAQYLVALALISAVLFLAKRRRAAVVLAVLAVPDLAAVAPFWLGQPAGAAVTANSADSAGDPLRLLAHNVHRANRDHANTIETIRREDPDVLVVLEVNGRWQRELEVLRDRLPHAIVRARQDNFGIALYSKLEIESMTVRQLGGLSAPTIAARLAGPNGPFTVIATHPYPPVSRATSNARDHQLEAAGELAKEISGPIVLIGDLNCTPFSPRFTALVESSGLVDSSRGFGLQPTWPESFFPLRIPIDHCLVSPDVHIVDRRTGPASGSDHRALIVDLVATE